MLTLALAIVVVSLLAGAAARAAPRRDAVVVTLRGSVTTLAAWHRRGSGRLEAHALSRRALSIAERIRAAFPDDPATAECIAAYESTGTPGHFNPRARNGANLGLMQINSDAHSQYDRRRLLEVAYNLRAARELYLAARRRWGWRGRWVDWTTRRLCGA